MNRRKFWKKAIPTFAVLVLVGLVLTFFFTALSNLDDGNSAEGRLQLEKAIRRAAVSCYSTEGFYPPDLDYLVRHYGLQIDESRYTVFYEAIAENLMPAITVIDKTA